MKIKPKSLKFTIIFIVIVVAAILLLSYLGIGTLKSATRIGYVGNDGWSSWSASYTLLDGRMQHTISPKTETLHVKVKTESGTISIEMKDADGNIFFSEKDMETSSYEVEVSGKVVIKINADHHKGSFDISSHSSSVVQSGEIFLYGEEHANKAILEKEFELWSTYYHDNGMRDLFVELPYYSAEVLNLWMQSDTDDILDQLYQDWEGTSIHSQDVIDFYKQIKNECPETIFHGTDVGHQYNTTGERYLAYLRESGQGDGSEKYRLTQEVIEQGQYYYKHSDAVYRENKMVENFIREFESLNGANVMGIYGTAHTWIDAKDYVTNTVPCMANQLNEYYGDVLHSKDLTLVENAYRVDTLQIGDKEYMASYFGKIDLSASFPDYQYREFWRLENAYDDFKDFPKTGDVLPYNNYPMEIEEGQVFVIEYTKTDGSVSREYRRADGNTWRGMFVTEEFRIEK